MISDTASQKSNGGIHARKNNLIYNKISNEKLPPIQSFEKKKYRLFIMGFIHRTQVKLKKKLSILLKLPQFLNSTFFYICVPC